MELKSAKSKYEKLHRTYGKVSLVSPQRRNWEQISGLSSQSYGFSSSHVRVWELDHKKAECQRIDAFELWCWRRLLGVPWSARRSNWSILKEISPEYSLEGLTAEAEIPATWCEELSHWKRPWCWARLKAGGKEDRGWDGWMASLTQWTWVWASSRSWCGQGSLACYSPWGHKESDRTKQLNWIEISLVNLHMITFNKYG